MPTWWASCSRIVRSVCPLGGHRVLARWVTLLLSQKANAQNLVTDNFNIYISTNKKNGPGLTEIPLRQSGTSFFVDGSILRPSLPVPIP